MAKNELLINVIATIIDSAAAATTVISSALNASVNQKTILVYVRLTTIQPNMLCSPNTVIKFFSSVPLTIAFSLLYPLFPHAVSQLAMFSYHFLLMNFRKRKGMNRGFHGGHHLW